jgi:Domain of unknown function (DUF3943)
MIKLYILLFIFLISIGNIFCQEAELSSSLKMKLSEKNSKNILSLLQKSSISDDDENKISLHLKSDPVKLKKFTKSSDILDPDYVNKYPLWIPITEVVGLHTTVCLVSNYILHNEFAKISFKSVEQNFKTGFVWDPDYFVTNYFAHPYNGSIYYNAARANGYNYYVSSVFAFGGSLTWELFMETEPPAINDVINTTISGIFLGEVTHRLSSLLIDDNTTGFERVMREIGIGIIDVSRGFNRLFQGKSWAVNKHKYNRKPLALNGYYGVNWNNYGTKIGTGIANGVAGFGLIYGNPFAEKKREIMDFFRLSGNFNIGAGQPFVGSLEGYGLLFGKSRKVSKKSDRLLGIFHHYDYYENKAYEIGAITFGVGLLKRTKTSESSNLLYSIHLGIVPLGASKSAYIDTTGQERNYSFNGGLNTKLELSYAAKWGLIYAGYNLFWFRTYVGISGNEYYGIFRPKIVINVSKNVGIGAQFLFAHKEGFYSDYPNVDGRAYQGMLLLQYKFGDIAF